MSSENCEKFKNRKMIWFTDFNWKIGNLFCLMCLSQILTGVLSILISIWLERCFMTFIVSTDCVSVYNTSDLVTFIMPGCKAKQPFLWQESANTYQVWYVLQIMVGFYCLGPHKIFIFIFVTSFHIYLMWRYQKYEWYLIPRFLFEGWTRQYFFFKFSWITTKTTHGL